MATASHAGDLTTGAAAPRTQDTVVSSSKGRALLAALRITTGFIFLWAFLDKAFGLGYSTPSEKSWVNGGTPSQGFLTNAAIGPFKDFFVNIASPASDWLFMLGMLGVGLAVVLGIGLRVSAGAGSLIMIMMWMAEWPPTKGTTNPLIDYHIIYALVLIVAAVLLAGDTWGLGRWWARLPIVQRLPWLR